MFCIASVATARAGPRVSASYSVPTDSADAGGRRTTSTAYTNDGSAGGITGLSTVASPAETVKSGYVGQLYDVIGLVVNAPASAVNETATLQLAAWQFLDDATLVAVNASSVAWGVVSGPIGSISASGLATAAAVYQDAPASVQGALGGFTGTLNLTVLDSIPDNFGAYAGDGIGDDWQVQYFGLPPNANAAPNADFDHTGQTNLFKFIAGLNPLDGSRFVLSIAPVAGQPSQKNLVFTPVIAGRTYVVKSHTDLTLGSWTALTGTTQLDAGTQRTVTDLNAVEVQKFYRIEITKP